MSGKASLAVFLGLALLAANVWRAGANQASISAHWKTWLLELGGVVVASFIANTTDGAATVVIVAFVILWVLFLINTVGKTAGQQGSPKPSTSQKAGMAA